MLNPIWPLHLFLIGFWPFFVETHGRSCQLSVKCPVLDNTTQSDFPWCMSLREICGPWPKTYHVAPWYLSIYVMRALAEAWSNILWYTQSQTGKYMYITIASAKIPVNGVVPSLKMSRQVKTKIYSWISTLWHVECESGLWVCISTNFKHTTYKHELNSRLRIWKSATPLGLHMRALFTPMWWRKHRNLRTIHGWYVLNLPRLLLLGKFHQKRHDNTATSTTGVIKHLHHLRLSLYIV